MSARLGTVKLLKDLHVGGAIEPVSLTEATGLVWDTRDGVYAKLIDVDLTETHILQGWSYPAPRYDTKIFHHWNTSVGMWLLKGTVVEVIYLTAKGVRVRTGFPTPHKAMYVHHDDFVWVTKPIGSEAWQIQPEDLYR